jgi:ArsR family transcriptional regulator
MKGGAMTPARAIPIPLKPRRRGPARAATPRGADEELATLAKAIGHPARVAIVRMLLERGECLCGGIVDRMPLAQATVSQHLKVLKEAGWIEGEVDGPRVCYCAKPETVERFIQLAKDLRRGKE